jgi:hypothetical protein
MVRVNPSRQDERAQQGQPHADALRLLNAMIRDFQYLIDPEQRPTTKMVYTHAVVLWMLVLQRLGGGLSLNDVVSHLLNHDRDLLPDNRRVREHTLSENSSAYAQGRKRLPTQTILDFSQAACDHLASVSPPLIDGRRAFLLDGTTMTLAPTPALQEAFPPATNQFGSTVWPVAQLMVANELQSGCALLPQVDPMYGDNNASEAVQASRIVRQLPARSIVMADSGFGIYSVAHHTHQAGHDFLFRLTKSRFKSMRRKAVLIAEGEGYKTYHLLWEPSAKDRKSLPDLPAEASLNVVLHEVDLADAEDKTLYLVTGLELDGPTCGRLYRRRYDVEFDIRDFKVTLDAENIRAKSVEMFKKELYASVVAYNLVAQFRRQAAQLSGVKPRRLSFKGVWTCLRDRLLLQPSCSFEEWLDRYASALHHAAQKKHPQRKSPRSYPRKAHPRRQKTTKFEKSQRTKKQAEDPATPTLAKK